MELPTQSGWCLIESDPGVFTELVHSVGVRGVIFKEVYGLDKETFDELERHPLADVLVSTENSSINVQNCNILGFIFLFNWSERQSKRGGANTSNGGAAMDSNNVYFAKQVVENACASQAIVSVLLNSRESVELGESLSNLYEFSKDFDPQIRGEAIGNCDELRKAHNSFSVKSSFDVVREHEEQSKDAFHYVAYVYINGAVYELDGLHSGPILVEECEKKDWVETVRKAVQKSVEEIQSGGSEIRFNLLAMVQDPLPDVEYKVETLTKRLNQVNAPAGGDAMDTDITPFNNEQEKEQAMISLQMLQNYVSHEVQTRQSWKVENARRRHDFVPFVLATLKHLARRGELVNAVEQAKAAAQRSEQKRQKRS